MNRMIDGRVQMGHLLAGDILFNIKMLFTPQSESERASLEELINTLFEDINGRLQEYLDNHISVEYTVLSRTVCHNGSGHQIGFLFEIGDLAYPRAELQYDFTVENGRYLFDTKLVEYVGR